MDASCVESGRESQSCGLEACDEKVSPLTAVGARLGVESVVREAAVCGFDYRTRTHQTALLRRLLHLGVQQRLEVLDEEDHAVGPADREEEVLLAVGVGGEAAHGIGPLLELQLVGGVVELVRARRLSHQHPEPAEDRRQREFLPAKTQCSLLE